MKGKVTAEYIGREIKMVAQIQIEWRKSYQCINAQAVGLVSYSVGIVDCMKKKNQDDIGSEWLFTQQK